MSRKRAVVSLWVVLFFLLSTFVAAAERARIEKANYKLAVRFTPEKLKKMVFTGIADTHWLKHSDRFWYEFETSDGKTYYIVDPLKRAKQPLFDNVFLAAQLTKLTKDPYDAKHLPLEGVKFIKDDRVVFFKVAKNKDIVEEEKRKEEQEKGEKDVDKTKDKEKDKDKEKEKSAVEKAKEDAKKYHSFEYELASGKLTLLENYQGEPKRPDWANLSPDGNAVIFARHHNLYLMDKANYEKALKDEEDKSIVDQQLTTDGEENYSYQMFEYAKTDTTKEKNKDKRKAVSGTWSRDSKKFALVREDERKVKNLWVIHNIAEPRPELETYKYPMPGEPDVPQAEILIFDIVKKDKIKVKADRFKDQYLWIFSAEKPASARDDDYTPTVWLSETSDKLYFSRHSRDRHRLDFCVADSASGEVKVLVEERLNTYVDQGPFRLVGNGQELVLWSERDGWGHFYLYDGSGSLKKQMTSGTFHCDNIVGLDEKTRVLYFTANGREDGEDPYYIHLYRVGLDGSGLKLLNPGNFDHNVSMGDSHRFFVDGFSRVDTAPKSVVYDTLGNVLRELDTADTSLLTQNGFKFPETFKVKAADGLTDLYGVMYKPYDFDEAKLYPIIAYVYPGPQTELVTKGFMLGWYSRLAYDNMALAQLGFIVMEVGNRGGHPDRSKWYHNYGYGNLRDYGLADKKAAIEQLAARHPWIDIDRVGITGHSGGGFMSTAAMLVYPDFFKVAVSAAGNHDNNVYHYTWSERHHGIKEIQDKDGNVKFEYSIEKNSDLAKNLKGHLLLVTGDVDDNVHPANTIRMANALIRANKRFDFFLLPGQSHGFGDMDPYFFWLKVDYFCKHLIGDYSQAVDIEELNREKEMTGEKKKS